MKKVHIIFLVLAFVTVCITASVKVHPFKEEGGSACNVVDCNNEKLTQHKYCNPYACTSERSAPLEISFNVSQYRNEHTTALLYWRKVNPPYKYMKFEYVVSANNEQIYQGEIHGCTFEPTLVRNKIELNTDIINIKWTAVGVGWLLIGDSNCNATSTNAYLKIGTDKEEKKLKDEL